MLTIGELFIRLPAEFRDRAENIVSLTAEQLAKYESDATVRIDALELQPMQLDMQQTDESISEKIAKAILTELKHRL